MSKVIIFPTDTVYGIGTPIFDIEGIKRIYEIKHRNKNKPLACLCADLNQIEEIAVVDEQAKALIHKFLPGALTLILKSKEAVVQKIGYETIAVRIPKHEVALKILKENGPMLTTSVNESGSVPINEYEDIKKIYEDKVDAIYETHTPSSNISSTIVCCLNGKLEITRQGEIKLEDLSV